MILVVGAGVAGLSCALSLHRAGREFLLIEADSRVFHLNRHRHDSRIERPSSLSLKGALVRAQGKSILLLTTDRKLTRYSLRSQTHIQVDRRIMLGQVGVRAKLIARHRHHTHTLGTTSNHHLRLTKHHLLGSRRNRLQTGGTETVDRHPTDTIGQPGALRSNTGHIETLFALRHRAAHNHILNLTRIQTGSTIQDRLHHQRCQLIGANRA